MALIQCPECGNGISDKSDICVHCGYPLINYNCSINGIIYNFKDELPIALLDGDKYFPAIGSIRRKTSLTLSDGCELVKIIRNTKKIPEVFTPKDSLEDRSKYSNNVPKCPTCGSTNIGDISTLNRAVSVGMVGLASSKIGKTKKCNNCGYMW